jgi:drug/metabolite transporter (DMT)-like permease
MMKHLHHAWPGIPIALASAALFGLSTPLAKLLLGTVDPWLLAGLLYLGSGLGLLAAQLGRDTLGIEPAEAPLRRADLPWVAAVVLAGGIVGPVLLLLGLIRTEASTAALLLNLEGLATMGIAWLVWHRQLVGRRSRRVGCCRPYAAAATSLTSAQSSKALVRAARYSLAVTCSRQRGKRLLI